jgi:hypothetical protein
MHIHFEEITLFIHRLLFLLLVNILQSVIALSASSLSIQDCIHGMTMTDTHTISKEEVVQKKIVITK